MRFKVTKAFIEEACRYQLRSACTDCQFYNPSQKACIHGWPIGPQNLVVDEQTSVDAEIEFCKEFQLR